MTVWYIWCRIDSYSDVVNVRSRTVNLSFSLQLTISLQIWNFMKGSCLMKSCSSLSFPASGILKGYDPLINLVLDNTTEFLRGEWNHNSVDYESMGLFTNKTRKKLLCGWHQMCYQYLSTCQWSGFHSDLTWPVASIRWSNFSFKQSQNLYHIFVSNWLVSVRDCKVQ